MKRLVDQIKVWKRKYSIDQAYLFGSYLEDKDSAKDIDIILYKDAEFDEKILSQLSIQINKSRVQYNCYKAQDKYDQNQEYLYDIVAIDNLMILENFRDINNGRITII